MKCAVEAVFRDVVIDLLVAEDSVRLWTGMLWAVRWLVMVVASFVALGRDIWPGVDGMEMMSAEV